MCDPEDSHVPMTHDGYFKIWQLSDHNMGAGVAPQCPWHGDSMVRRPRPFGQQRAYCCCSECNYQHPPGNDYILVDEAQDLTPCQADVLFHQHKSHVALYVVGDEHQLLYGWRGVKRESFVDGPFLRSCPLRLGGGMDRQRRAPPEGLRRAGGTGAGALCGGAACRH